MKLSWPWGANYADSLSTAEIIHNEWNTVYEWD